MKKLFIKSGVMLMLALTMVSCKKDITEELEASNESSNKGALLPPNANNYYIDSIIINDGTSRVVKFDYDVPNKKIMIYKKSISRIMLIFYVVEQKTKICLVTTISYMFFWRVW